VKTSETPTKRKKDELEPDTSEREKINKGKKSREELESIGEVVISDIPYIDDLENKDLKASSEVNIGVITDNFIKEAKELGPIPPMSLQQQGVQQVHSAQIMQGQDQSLPTEVNIPWSLCETLLTKLLTPLQNQLNTMALSQAEIVRDLKETKVDVKKAVKESVQFNENLKSLENRLAQRVDDVDSKVTDTNIRIDMVDESLTEVRALAERALSTALESLSVATQARKQVQTQAKITKFLSEKQIREEIEARKYNLRFLGVREEGKETWDESVKTIRKVLEVNFGCQDAGNIEIVRAHRLGVKSTKYHRVLIVRFGKLSDKQHIFRKRFGLQNPKMKVQEDFPAIVVARRKILLPVFHAIRVANENRSEVDKYHLSIVADSLFFQKRMFTVDTINTITSPFKPEEIAKREIGDSVFFYTAGSPFSNHHPCTFVVNDITYNSSEQFLMWLKAKCAGDGDARERIMSEDDPVAQLRIGKNLKNLDEAKWDSEVFDLFKPGLTAKFSQNQNLKEKLLSTGTKRLAEASLNSTWGIGIKLEDPALGQKGETGLNRLGKLLTSVRDDLRKE
jgi:hypothetical protein